MNSHIWQILRICNETKGDVNLIATYTFRLLNLAKELRDLIIWRNRKEELETLFFEEQRDFASRIFPFLSKTIFYRFGLSKEIDVCRSFARKNSPTDLEIEPYYIRDYKTYPHDLSCTQLIIPVRFIAREQDLHASFNYAIVIYRR